MKNLKIATPFTGLKESDSCFTAFAGTKSLQKAAIYGEPAFGKTQNVAFYGEHAPDRAHKWVGGLAVRVAGGLAGWVGWLGWLAGAWLTGWLAGGMAGWVSVPGPTRPI